MSKMAKTQLKFLLMCVCILVPETTKCASGVIALAPLNRVVYEGSTNTTITCESNDPYLDWLIIPFAGSSALSLLTTDGEMDFPFNDSFAIDHPQGTEVYTLVIFNATISPSDRATISTAGIYQCYYYATGSAVAAQLVVIRTDPICSSNFTQSTAMLHSGDVIQLSCTIVYGAFRVFRIDAVMSWSVNGQPISADNATFTINSSLTEITATSTLVVNQNSDETYECGTTFSQTADDTLPGIANNAPDYFKTCTISLSLLTKTAKTAEDTITSVQETMTPCSSSSSVSIRRGPLCSRISINSTSSNVSCNVTFADCSLQPILPIVTWKQNGAYLTSDTLRTERIDPDVFYAESTITIISGAPKNYRCELTFAAPTDIRYPWIAKTAPKFKKSCSIRG